MADQQGPSKNDIQAILKRLRSQGPNKICFDCSAKNPTWATVTYGVFICIDCSAVHRSLGVHLTFVRSTQLDTNWTWIQLRQMQLGGNANAHSFFQQHNCTTNDSNQKYNSRAAQLYRDKLQSAAIQAMKIHGTKLMIDSAHESPAEEPKKEVDFFEEHEKFQLSDNNIVAPAVAPISTPAFQAPPSSAASLSGGAPSVAGILSPSSLAEPDSERKHIIGNRKPVAKKSGLGAKKGLGAQRVKTNFSEIEQKAALADQMKETAAHEAKLQAERTAEEEEKQIASMRLAYQDLSVAQKKEEDKLRTVDPKKATQMERLGMGFATRSGISHNATNDMQMIEQDAPVKSSSSSSSYGSLRKSLYERDDDDDFPFTGFGSYKNEGKSMDVLVTLIREVERDHDWDTDNDRERDRERERERDRERERERERERDRDLERERHREREAERDRYKSGSGGSWDRSGNGGASRSHDSTPSTNEAQKKFGGAKAISSDQYFADSDANSWERKANLSRFEGSTSISSADYFGNGSSSNMGSHGGYGNQMSAPDLEDMKESVRQGVTKVAGKLSSLANGVMSSLQDRYGGY